jgi:hypothetical protein
VPAGVAVGHRPRPQLVLGHALERPGVDLGQPVVGDHRRPARLVRGDHLGRHAGPLQRRAVDAIDPGGCERRRRGAGLLQADLAER